MDCMRFTVRQAGIPLEEAIMCATIIRLRRLASMMKQAAFLQEREQIFVLLNDDLDIVSVYIDGKEISC